MAKKEKGLIWHPYVSDPVPATKPLSVGYAWNSELFFAEISRRVSEVLENRLSDSHTLLTDLNNAIPVLSTSPDRSGLNSIMRKAHNYDKQLGFQLNQQTTCSNFSSLLLVV